VDEVQPLLDKDSNVKFSLDLCTKCSLPKGQYKNMIYFDYLVTIIHVVTFDESSSLDIVQDFMFIGAS
jgi:hypothetical protein